MEDESLTIFDSSPGTKNYEQMLLTNRLAEILSNYGLDEQQAKVFIYLGKYGKSTATKISTFLQINRTQVYKLLSELQNMGIVYGTFHNPIQFNAFPLDKAVKTLISAEKVRLKDLQKSENNLLKAWKKTSQKIGEQTEFQKGEFKYIRRMERIQNKIQQMYSRTENEFIFFGPGKILSELVNSKVLDLIQCNKTDSKFLLYSDLSCTDSYLPNIKIKKTLQLDLNLCFVIKDNEEMVYFEDSTDFSRRNSVALWTDSKLLIHLNKNLFNSTWPDSEIIQP